MASKSRKAAPKKRRDRGARKRGALKPHAAKKAIARVLSLDEQWAAGIREKVLADCHPFQRDAVEDPSRFITLLVGRGGGKTTTIRARAILKLTSIRRGRLLYFALTKDQAEELLWEPLKASIEYYGLTDEFEFHDSKLRVRCKRTGATLRLCGLDKPREAEKYRGQPFDEVYLDEAASYSADLVRRILDRIIGPRLGERHGCIVMSGTPGHILDGPFYDFTRPGATVEGDDGEPIPLHRPWCDRERPEFDGWDGYSSHSWTLLDVVSLPEAARKYIALVNLWAEALKVKKRNRWSDRNPIWLREYLGQWAADETDMVFQYRAFAEDGSLWNRWRPYGDERLEGLVALRRAIAALPKVAEGVKLTDWRFVLAGDKGSSDPFALSLLAFAPVDPTRTIWHVYSFERTRMYAKPIADMLLGADVVGRMLRGEGLDVDNLGGLFGLTGWPDASVCDSDQAFLDELGNVYGVRMKKAEKKADYKAGCIELVNGDLVDGRIKVIEGSPLERQLLALQWVEDANGKLRENKKQANHSTDTLIYGRREIANLFESGQVDQPRAPGAAGAAYDDPQGLEADPGIGTERHREQNSGLMADPVFHDPWG